MATFKSFGRHLSVAAAGCGLWMASAAPAPRAAAPANLVHGCIDRFDPGTDYFPDKAAVEDAVNFSVTYQRSFKVVDVRTAAAGSRERYVLVQCGAPAPSPQGDLAGAQVVRVPIASLYSASTTHMALLAAQEPAVLLLDEPTAFLDVLSRVELMGLLRRLTRDSAIGVVMSTHDLELAMRCADTVWLLMPGGELMSGAPEDVILAGGIAQALEGRDVRFQPEERSFRWLTAHRGSALLSARGLHEVMARGVLEREGYAVSVDAGDGVIALDVDDCGWSVSGEDANGESFASLAAYLRKRPSS
jgi:energy-coupling factor transporter ATP-binding protein EcfA2